MPDLHVEGSFCMLRIAGHYSHCKSELNTSRTCITYVDFLALFKRCGSSALLITALASHLVGSNKAAHNPPIMPLSMVLTQLAYCQTEWRCDTNIEKMQVTMVKKIQWPFSLLF